MQHTLIIKKLMKILIVFYFKITIRNKNYWLTIVIWNTQK